MPNKDTFSMKPVRELLQRVVSESDVVVDPFARNALWGTITNDLDPDTKALYHMEAEDFCAMLEPASADVILLDPPYSPRQASECYKGVGLKKGMEGTQTARLYAACRNLLTPVLCVGGRAVSFGWNSTGFGITRGFDKEELLIINHGGAHNDTLVLVERRVR